MVIGLDETSRIVENTARLTVSSDMSPLPTNIADAHKRVDAQQAQQVQAVVAGDRGGASRWRPTASFSAISDSMEIH